MLHEGPEIARRADRVAALSLAPIASPDPITVSRLVSFFRPLGALCAPMSDIPISGAHISDLPISGTQCAQNAISWQKLVRMVPVI